MNSSNYLCTKRAARHLGLSPRTLENYRQAGKGPRYVRFGEKLVRYHIEDLEAWPQMEAA